MCIPCDGRSRNVYTRVHAPYLSIHTQVTVWGKDWVKALGKDLNKIRLDLEAELWLCETETEHCSLKVAHWVLDVHQFG